MSKYHIIDNDDLTGYRVYEEVERTIDRDGNVATVLVKAGTVFADLKRAVEYVDLMNAKQP